MDVMTLALALRYEFVLPVHALCLCIHLLYRAARLQHAGSLPNAIKQRIAVETLQVWAPLSFQVGLSNHIPELEVFMYIDCLHICFISCPLTYPYTLCIFMLIPGT